MAAKRCSTYPTTADLFLIWQRQFTVDTAAGAAQISPLSVPEPATWVWTAALAVTWSPRLGPRRSVGGFYPVFFRRTSHPEDTRRVDQLRSSGSI